MKKLFLKLFFRIFLFPKLWLHHSLSTIALIGLARTPGVCTIIFFTAIMEQHALKNVNSCLNTNIYSYLKKYSCQNSNLYLKVVHFLKHLVLIRHLCQLKTVVFLHWCLIHAVLLLRPHKKLECLPLPYVCVCVCNMHNIHIKFCSIKQPSLQ